MHRTNSLDSRKREIVRGALYVIVGTYAVSTRQRFATARAAALLAHLRHLAVILCPDRVRERVHAARSEMHSSWNRAIAPLLIAASPQCSSA
jgi:hypothetical protein